MFLFRRAMKKFHASFHILPIDKNWLLIGKGSISRYLLNKDIWREARSLDISLFDDFNAFRNPFVGPWLAMIPFQEAATICRYWANCTGIAAYQHSTQVIFSLGKASCDSSFKKRQRTTSKFYAVFRSLI